MKKIIRLIVSPEEAADINSCKALAAKQLGVDPSEINHIQILKRSVDARSRNIKVNLDIEIIYNDPGYIPQGNIAADIASQYKKADSPKTVIIVGAGPAGLFA